jgi:SagB-type dehydrogenase family enzyme
MGADMHDADTLQALALANSYRVLQPWVESTALRTRELEHRTLGQPSAPRPAEEFLLDSRYHRHDRRIALSTQPYFTDVGQATVSLVGAEPAPPGAVALPPSVPLDGTLGRALGERRSHRAFSGTAAPLAQLATVVRAAAAVTDEGIVRLSDGRELPFCFRSAPSAGGLYPVEVHVAALRVDGLEPRVYRYAARHDALVAVTGTEGAEQLCGCCASAPDAEHLARAAFVLVFVAQPWRSMRKYGSRGVRFLFIEVGAMVQAAHLAAQALGLGSVDCGAFCDEEVHRCLGLDGVLRCLAHATIAGVREAQA